LFTVTPTASPLFEDYLLVEHSIFGDEYPLAAANPALNLFIVYRFALENLTFLPSYTTLCVNNECSLLALYLAFRGGQIISERCRDLRTLQERAEKTASVPLAIHFQDPLTRLKATSVDRMLAFNPTIIQLAEGLRALKSGGRAVISFPVNRKPKLDTFPGGRMVKKQFIKDKMPLESVNPHEFANFWQKTLMPAERQKWAWASALFADVFNTVSEEPDGAHTVLYVLEKG
jgi:hypothetical protein